MIKVADRVKEQSATTGTGSYVLNGASAGHQTFAAALGNGGQSYYVATDGTSWETGVGTITAGSPDILSRDLILKSSNSDAAVNWSTGIRDIFISPPADYFGGKSNTYIRNVSNSANSTLCVAGVPTTLPLNGLGNFNFATFNAVGTKVGFDDTFNGGLGGIIVDGINPQSDISIRFSFVNLDGGLPDMIAQIFLVDDKSDPSGGEPISASPVESQSGIQQALEITAFHGGIQAIYPRLISPSNRNIQLNGFKITVDEISVEV